MVEESARELRVQGVRRGALVLLLHRSIPTDEQEQQARQRRPHPLGLSCPPPCWKLELVALPFLKPGCGIAMATSMFALRSRAIATLCVAPHARDAPTPASAHADAW
jgi:hypothetical protein